MARRDYRSGHDGWLDERDMVPGSPWMPASTQRERDERAAKRRMGRGGPYQDVDPGGIGGEIIGQARGYSGAGFDEWGRAIGDMRESEGFQRDIMEGRNSLSAEQLRQGLQQNLAAARSQTASVRGGDRLAALAGASQNAARMGTALSGQQALAGIQERRAAAEALARSQQARMGSGQGMATQNLGTAAGMQGSIIGGQSSHYGTLMGKPREPADWERALGAAGSVAQIYAMMNGVPTPPGGFNVGGTDAQGGDWNRPTSDVRAKENIEGASDEVMALHRGLGRFTRGVTSIPHTYANVRRMKGIEGQARDYNVKEAEAREAANQKYIEMMGGPEKMAELEQYTRDFEAKRRARAGAHEMPPTVITGQETGGPQKLPVELVGQGYASRDIAEMIQRAGKKSKADSEAKQRGMPATDDDWRGGKVGTVRGLSAANALSGAKPYAYNYKNPARHGKGERVGIMAQDLEKTPAGRALVSTGPDGMKQIDVGGLTTANSAAIAELIDKYKELEDKVSK